MPNDRLKSDKERQLVQLVYFGTPVWYLESNWPLGLRWNYHNGNHFVDLGKNMDKIICCKSLLDEHKKEMGRLFWARLGSFPCFKIAVTFARRHILEIVFFFLSRSSWENIEASSALFFKCELKIHYWMGLYTISNEYELNWTQPRLDSIPNRHDHKPFHSRMDTIPNTHDAEKNTYIYLVAYMF